MHYEQLYSFLIPKLETGLPSYLTYHNLQHTLDVISSAEKLARKENVGGDDLVLVKTAALMHDAGFLESHEQHEDHACKMARTYLTDFDYSNDQVERICDMIMATKYPQTPHDKLSEILCDADLFYLGTDQYAAKSDQLYNELKSIGIIRSGAEWEMMQVNFLSSHHYFTNSAIADLEGLKKNTLQQLKARLGYATSGHINKRLELIQDIVLTLFGVAIAAIALKLFMVPNRFFDGGITGISLLIHEIFHFDLGVVLLLLNFILIFIGYFSVGKKFAYRTFISVILLSICLSVIPDYPITADKLLISIFGGVFLGIGAGLVMRAGAALDGIDVLALYTLKKTSFTITEIILGINIIIFCIAGFKFGIESALYSILTYFCATRCIVYVVEGFQEYTGVTIVSGKSEVLKYQLVNKLGRGITVYKGERGFLPGKFEIKTDCDIIFTVITRLELRRLKTLVYDVDPQAFIFASSIKEASGGIIKRRTSH